MGHETATAQISARVASSDDPIHKMKRKKPGYISVTMCREANEGAGNFSVQSSEKAEACVSSPRSAQPATSFW